MVEVTNNNISANTLSLHFFLLLDLFDATKSQYSNMVISASHLLLLNQKPHPLALQTWSAKITERGCQTCFILWAGAVKLSFL